MDNTSVIISFSLHGNNRALGDRLAECLGLPIIHISEPKKRTHMTVLLDRAFKRTPKVIPSPKELDNYNRIIFVSPIWIGMPANPLKAYFKHINGKNKDYIYVSLCGAPTNSKAKIIKFMTNMASNGPKDIILFPVVNKLPAVPAAKNILKQCLSEEYINEAAENVIKQLPSEFLPSQSTVEE